MNKKDVMNQYKEIAESYQSFEDCYKLIIETNNIEICKFCLDSDGIWKRLELKWMLKYFQNLEEYEKCSVLSILIKDNFIADKYKQYELNMSLFSYLTYMNSLPHN